MGLTPSKQAVFDALSVSNYTAFRNALAKTDPTFLLDPLAPADFLPPPPGISPRTARRNRPAPADHPWLHATPLHILAEQRDPRFLATALDALASRAQPDCTRAALSARDADGRTPLSRAVHADLRAAVAALLRAGAQRDEPFAVAARDARDAAAAASRRKRARAPLPPLACRASHARYAASHGCASALDALLRAGADVEAWGADGKRAVHLAVECGHAACVRLLLARDGLTPAEGGGTTRARPSSEGVVAGGGGDASDDEDDDDGADGGCTERDTARKGSGSAVPDAEHDGSGTDARLSHMARIHSVERYVVREAVPPSPPARDPQPLALGRARGGGRGGGGGGEDGGSEDTTDSGRPGGSSSTAAGAGGSGSDDTNDAGSTATAGTTGGRPDVYTTAQLLEATAGLLGVGPGVIARPGVPGVSGGGDGDGEDTGGDSPDDLLAALQSAVRDAVHTVAHSASSSSAAAPRRQNRDRGASLLHLACINGHADVARLLLSIPAFRASVEEMNDSGKAPIFMAIRHASFDCLRALVDAGADVNATDIENWTPLHEAVKTGDGHTAMLKYLIHGCGADVHAVDDDGWTPLHVAARFSSALAVDILIDAGVAVDALTEDNESALLLASAQPESAGVLQRLLANGADLGVHRGSALTPARLILSRKDYTQLCIVLDHLHTLPDARRRDAIDVDARSESGDTLLHVCVVESVDATTKLIAAGARLDERNHDGVAPLHVACKVGGSQAVDQLLAAGADANIERGDGLLPMHVACDSGHLDVVRTLIEHGCDVNRLVTLPGRYNGFSPLMFAARLGHADITRAMIDAGAQLDVAKGDGYTALHLAALNGNTGSCRALIASGANYRAADENGYLPLQLATRHNQFDVVRAMLEADVDANSGGSLGMTSLHIASFTCEARLMWLLIRGGADVNAVNSDKTTPLHVAAGRENGRVGIQVLLANGALVDPADDELDTPLHNASYKGLYLNARLLLRRGAVPSPVNINRVTPLHLAAAVGSEETVEALVRFGADLAASDARGRTPYAVAAESGHRKAMVLLFRGMKTPLSRVAPTSIFRRRPGGGGNGSSGSDAGDTDADADITETELMCVICQTALVEGEKVRTLPCKHVYHDECILEWLGNETLLRHDSCPLCQAAVLPFDVILSPT